VIKRMFGFAKVRYRGLMKNGNRVVVTAALANNDSTGTWDWTETARGRALQKHHRLGASGLEDARRSCH